MTSTTAPNQTSLPIAITMGDAAGIGPEIIARAFQTAPQDCAGCFVVGDVATLRRAAKVVAGQRIPWPVAVLSEAHEALHCPPGCLPVLPLASARGQSVAPVPFGALSARAGQMAGDAVVWAAQAALKGEVAALVTAPLNKAALAMAGGWLAGFPGHTEMLQALAAAHLNTSVAQLPVRMMLANDELRVVLVSIHVSLRAALAAVTFDSVLQSLLITHRSLLAVLGRAPRIGVAGLNPHAGEGGLFGREEIEVIGPAVAAARAQGVLASDPLAPDTVFMRARATVGQPGEFDVVLAMYHDQGLIPVKYLGVEKGVNVTLGLPLVRTSPDHGTAFDIAGTGRADASSLVQAIRTARHLCACGE
ncbi:MAG: 4-hydroxythreonine-4-phosphate dehydrogenase PdxA [Betaproteobacteria bacterium]|nr:4-hydroxythreonine-4-phosphate dehydrogenase PdxA [Betaproteobacteria bacterium]NCP81017.1 4-hydroxythreonine-4-phosphate dehydrogenase PdxA [Rhodoferax sp.]OIP16756.1 MAG: 4-hydroxythreonine-4-phosphate dehydrogenase PdxA [Comamonadaceae bacterium CG2_30_57_122]PIZ21386.1 MAG: 4-hydroxythreonine-4-phosphate dehydrogenase PdxA [Comamonadaceae bacterium CG_4_10_14_0_8_um_filter_57_29]PJC13185.1 MAG: 4-hydroxythreonine-4-phosphate dehydrogenase PdxA [Comamonadaceae bacterium CG_4_9_14_0_8_um_f